MAPFLTVSSTPVGSYQCLEGWWLATRRTEQTGGATGIIMCKDNWSVLDGVKEKEIICGDSGWLGETPMCYKDKCGPPPEVGS